MFYFLYVKDEDGELRLRNIVDAPNDSAETLLEGMSDLGLEVQIRESPRAANLLLRLASLNDHTGFNALMGIFRTRLILPSMAIDPQLLMLMLGAAENISAEAIQQILVIYNSLTIPK